jgi:hypothetical protein
MSFPELGAVATVERPHVTPENSDNVILTGRLAVGEPRIKGSEVIAAHPDRFSEAGISAKAEPPQRRVALP